MKQRLHSVCIPIQTRISDYDNSMFNNNIIDCLIHFPLFFIILEAIFLQETFLFLQIMATK